jgi:hypothetical protein
MFFINWYKTRKYQKQIEKIIAEEIRLEELYKNSFKAKQQETLQNDSLAIFKKNLGSRVINTLSGLPTKGVVQIR